MIVEIPSDFQRVMCVVVRSQDGFRGRIKLISGENYLPYDRIHLSKTLRTDPAVLRDAAFYSTAGIEVTHMTGHFTRSTASIWSVSCG